MKETLYHQSHQTVLIAELKTLELRNKRRKYKHDVAEKQ